MGSKSLYLEKIILDGYFGGTALPSIPANLFIALFTVAPTEGSDLGTEVSGGSYARKSLTNNATNFPAATQFGTNPALKVGPAFSFVAATGNWGTVVAFGVYDALTSGNLLYWGEVTPNVAVNSGITFSVQANQFQITET